MLTNKTAANHSVSLEYKLCCSILTKPMKAVKKAQMRNCYVRTVIIHGYLTLLKFDLDGTPIRIPPHH
jgi:hypothetical protein